MDVANTHESHPQHCDHPAATAAIEEIEKSEVLLTPQSMSAAVLPAEHDGDVDRGSNVDDNEITNSATADADDTASTATHQQQQQTRRNFLFPSTILSTSLLGLIKLETSRRIDIEAEEDLARPKGDPHTIGSCVYAGGSGVGGVNDDAFVLAQIMQYQRQHHDDYQQGQDDAEIDKHPHDQQDASAAAASSLLLTAPPLLDSEYSTAAYARWVSATFERRRRELLESEEFKGLITRQFLRRERWLDFTLRMVVELIQQEEDARATLREHALHSFTPFMRWRLNLDMIAVQGTDGTAIRVEEDERVARSRGLIQAEDEAFRAIYPTLFDAEAKAAEERFVARLAREAEEKGVVEAEEYVARVNLSEAYEASIPPLIALEESQRGQVVLVVAWQIINAELKQRYVIEDEEAEAFGAFPREGEEEDDVVADAEFDDEDDVDSGEEDAEEGKVVVTAGEEEGQTATLDSPPSLFTSKRQRRPKLSHDNNSAQPSSSSVALFSTSASSSHQTRLRERNGKVVIVDLNEERRRQEAEDDEEAMLLAKLASHNLLHVSEGCVVRDASVVATTTTKATTTTAAADGCEHGANNATLSITHKTNTTNKPSTAATATAALTRRQREERFSILSRHRRAMRRLLASRQAFEQAAQQQKAAEEAEARKRRAAEVASKRIKIGSVDPSTGQVVVFPVPATPPSSYPPAPPPQTSTATKMKEGGEEEPAAANTVTPSPPLTVTPTLTTTVGGGSVKIWPPIRLDSSQHVWGSRQEMFKGVGDAPRPGGRVGHQQQPQQHEEGERDGNESNAADGVVAVADGCDPSSTQAISAAAVIEASVDGGKDVIANKKKGSIITHSKVAAPPPAGNASLSDDDDDDGPSATMTLEELRKAVEEGWAAL